VKMTAARITEATKLCQQMDAAWQARLALSVAAPIAQALASNQRVNSYRNEAWRYLPDALDDLATLHEFVEAVCLHCAPCDVPADYKDSCPPMCADHDLCDALAALDLEAQ